MLHEEITSMIISAFFLVYNTLGYGLLEKVYENALLHELRKRGLKVECQVPIKVYTAEFISDAHKAQLINYLKATGIEVGFVLNFGPEATFKRLANTKNHPKKSV